jgi:DamX protein
MRKIHLSLTGLLGGCLLAACTPNTHQQMVEAQQNYLSQHYKVSFGQVQSAARMGDPDAQYALGYMFYYGKGTPQDTKLGTYWIRRAAAQGQPQAQQALAVLDSVKKPPEVAEDATPFFDDSQAIQSSKAYSATHRQTATISGASGASATRLVKPITLPKSIAASDSDVPSSTRQITPLTQVNDADTTIPVKKRIKTSPSNPRDFTGEERKLLAIPSDCFTLQLLDVRQENAALSFIRRNHLQGKAAYYCTYRDGRPLYIVVYGKYNSNKAARSAVKTLPLKVQQLHPWVKSLGKVHQDLKNK